MTKEELFKMMNEHPVMYVATNENGQPHVRAILHSIYEEGGPANCDKTSSFYDFLWFR